MNVNCSINSKLDYVMFILEGKFHGIKRDQMLE